GNWEPSPEEYEQYERLLWQAEFRKLIELDEQSLQNELAAEAARASTYISAAPTDPPQSLASMNSDNAVDPVKPRKIEHPLLMSK
ncbi:unnamed protein product, partial [Allacma fusca]